MIPALPGINHIIEVLDSFAAERPKKGSPPAVVLTGAPEVTAVATRYRERLRRGASDFTDLIPHALINETQFTQSNATSPEELTDNSTEPSDEGATSLDETALDLELLTKIAGQFQNTMPPGSGTLRLPLFDTCRDLLKVDDKHVIKLDPIEQRDHVLESLLQRRTPPALEEVPKVVGDKDPGWFGVVQRVIRAVVALPRKPLYRYWLNRRFAWVTPIARDAGIEAKDFLNVAVGLAARELDSRLTQQILLVALLTDLANAARPSILSKNRPRRTWAFVLLLGDIKQGSATRRLLDAYSSLGSVGRRPSPLMIIAAATEESTLPQYLRSVPGIKDADPASPTDPTRLQHSLERMANSVEHVVHRVILGPGEDSVAALWLARRQVNHPAPHRWWHWLRPIAPVVAVVVLAGGVSYAAVVHDEAGPPDCRVETVTNPHHDGGRASKERVGITNGDPSCSLDLPGNAERLTPIEAKIRSENAEVERLHEKGNNPYRTVVFFAPLTLPSDPGHIGPSSLPQLRGAVLAQKRANAAAAVDPHRMRIRLLVANPGDRFNHWRTATKQLIELVRADPTVAAIVGISQSRDESLKAISRLRASDVNLPIIGSAITGDNIWDASTDYFTVSPRNNRVAAAMASFARYELGEDAVTVFDPDDYYSRNLTDDFAHHYGELRESADVSTVEYRAESTTSASDVASEVCVRLSDKADFVMYAGRPQQFPALLHAMAEQPECQDQPKISVLGGTAMTAFAAHPAVDVENFAFLDLHYASFSELVPGKSAADTQSRFATGFREEFGAEYSAESDAAAGYDALMVASAAINRAFTDRGQDADFDPSIAAEKLRSGAVDIQGETGYVDFGYADRVPNDKRILIMNQHGEVELSCGRVSKQQTDTTWGEQQHACPKVD